MVAMATHKPYSEELEQAQMKIAASPDDHSDLAPHDVPKQVKLTNYILPIALGLLSLVLMYMNVRAALMPSKEAVLQEEAKEAIEQLKVSKDQQGRLFDQTQVLNLYKMIFTYQFKRQELLYSEFKNDRMHHYNNERWPGYELVVGELVKQNDELASQVQKEILDDAKLTPVQWQESKDKCLKKNKKEFKQQVDKLYLDVIKSNQKDIFKQCRDLENTLIAWKTLLLKEAELEDKMHTFILTNSDIDTYQQVIVFEMWKIHDSMFDMNSYDQPEMLKAFEHFKIGEDKSFQDFENELEQMIIDAKAVNIGGRIRRAIWKDIENMSAITYSSEQPNNEQKNENEENDKKKEEKDLTSILSQQSFIEITALIYKHTCDCIYSQNQKFADFQMDAYKSSDWSMYESYVQTNQVMEMMIYQHIYAYVLFKLQIGHAVMRKTYEINASNGRIDNLLYEIKRGFKIEKCLSKLGNDNQTSEQAIVASRSIPAKISRQDLVGIFDEQRNLMEKELNEKFKSAEDYQKLSADDQNKVLMDLELLKAKYMNKVLVEKELTDLDIQYAELKYNLRHIDQIDFAATVFHQCYGAHMAKKLEQDEKEQNNQNDKEKTKND